MSRIGFVLYRPRKGKEEELINMIQTHFPFLRQEGFITERKAVGMKTKDGSIMVVFEWKTRESIGEAATNSVVQNIWMQVSKVSDLMSPEVLRNFMICFLTSRH